MPPGSLHAIAASAPGVIVEAAPAKLNLTLRVTGKRNDGYHTLESLVAFTAYGDTLTLAPADDLSLQVNGPFARAAGEAESNSVLKALLLLQSYTGVTHGARATLTKRLAVGAGLGGGSADAAAALRAASRLWRLTLAPEALAALALQVGADVPACLGATTAFMRGIGEQVTPMPKAGMGLRGQGVVLLHPGAPLMTQRVFAQVRPPYSAPLAYDDAAHEAFLAKAGNDLEKAASELAPDIPLMLDALRRFPGCTLARMSGSGSACFGLFSTRDGAEEAGHHLAARHPAWWRVVTTLL